MQLTPEALRNIFTYHPPTGTQAARYELLRGEGLRFAERCVEHCPPSRELTLAIRHIEQAVMYANAAIARNEVALEDGDDS